MFDAARLEVIQNKLEELGNVHEEEGSQNLWHEAKGKRGRKGGNAKSKGGGKGKFTQPSALFRKAFEKWENLRSRVENGDKELDI